MKYHLSHSKKNWFKNPLVAVLLVGGMIWMGYAAVQAFLTFREARLVKENYKQEYELLVERERALREKNDFLTTERGIESEIRDRYRVVQPGEQLMLIVDNQEVVPEKKPSLWRKLRLFVGF